MTEQFGNHLHKRLETWRDKAIKALRDAIKDCPACSEAQAITCTDCEARYVANLKANRTAAIVPES